MANGGRVKNIVELAALAGVSAGTVSRALAGSTLISRQTRERIQALAREHDFRPNVMARNFRFGRAGAISVLHVPDPLAEPRGADVTFTTLLGHLVEGLAARGHDLLLSRPAADDPNWLDALANSGRADGIILVGQGLHSAAIDAVAADYLPLVVWGGHRPGQVHCAVGADDRKGGALAVRHLVERGCRRIAFLGDAALPEIAARLEGCRGAMADAGLADGLEVPALSARPDSPELAIANWLDSMAPPPDGIVAASDCLALRAVHVLARRGFAVPGQVRVVGYGNLFFATETVPSLSTISQRMEEGAGHLIDLLFRRIGGEKTDPVVLEPHLVVRQSS